jgi:hypothetical protein
VYGENAMKLKPPAGTCIAASRCGSVGSGVSPATMLFCEKISAVSEA